MNIFEIIHLSFTLFLLFIIFGYLFYKNIKNKCIELILHTIYKQHFFKLWPISSMAPHLLNVAFPDFSVKYFIMSFPSNQSINIKGNIPNYLNYWAITFYDKSGSIIKHWNDTDFPDFKYSITINHYTSFCIIVRYYFKSINTINSFNLLPNDLPLITHNKYIYSLTNSNNIIKNSNSLQKLFYKLYSNIHINYNFNDVYIHQFFLPNPTAVQCLFPNFDGIYLIALPSFNNVIKIQGIIPHSIGFPHNIRFIGFMASNLKTTATDSSISFLQLNFSYKLYVSYSVHDAIKYGYNPLTDHIILWNTSNLFPVLIYRQIQIDHSGLFQLKKATSNIDGHIIQHIMKDYYPTITCY